MNPRDGLHGPRSRNRVAVARASAPAGQVGDAVDVTANADAGATNAAAESVSALERGFSVLHCFAPGIAALSHQQIVRATGLPKATVSRITQTLVKLGYLDGSHRDGQFRLTAKTLDIGHVYLANIDVRAIAGPLMAELASYTSATVNLAVRSGNGLVVVETVRGRSAVVSIDSRVGFQFPIMQTAIGRAWLAGLPKAERAAAVKGLRPTVAAHEWKAMQARAATAIAECDAQGFCALQGEWRLGVNSVAAPIRADSGRELYVVNCAGPTLHLESGQLETDIGPRLLKIVRHIEQAVNVSWRQTQNDAT